MRQIWTLVVTLSLVVAPSLGDLLARRADACAVASCCIGKMNKSCPMRQHPSSSGFGIRSCGNDEQVAVAHHTVAVLAIETGERTLAVQPVAPGNPVTVSCLATTPPDPPPPRLS